MTANTSSSQGTNSWCKAGCVCVQRQDSRVEARTLQQDFLQKAKEDLEMFQRNCAVAASAHGLPASDAPGSSSRHSTEAAPGLDDQQEDGQPYGYRRRADSDVRAANGAAHRCAWLTMSLDVRQPIYFLSFKLALVCKLQALYASRIA